MWGGGEQERWTGRGKRRDLSVSSAILRLMKSGQMQSMKGFRVGGGMPAQQGRWREGSVAICPLSPAPPGCLTSNICVISHSLKRLIKK